MNNHISIAHGLFFYSKNDTCWNTKRPLCCWFSVFEDFFSSHLSFLSDRRILSASWLCSPLFQPFQSIVSISPPSALSYTLLLFYVKPLSFWTLTLAWMCAPRAPRRGVGFQLSGLEGGFPFQNVWLVNMSPGWKPISWKTGGMFSNPATGVCAICFFPHTHLKAESVNPLPAEVLSVRSKQPRSSLSEICC